MDSIRANRIKDDLLNELRLEFSADLEDKLCVVLVEGSEDVKLMREILDKEVVCKESFAGKSGLQELLDEPVLQKKNIIAIRDCDYADERQFPERMFTYDGCCMEMMLLFNQYIRNKFFRIFYQGDGSEQSYVFDAMRILAPYSMLRKKNEQEHGRINFQKVGFGDLVEKGIEFQISKLFERVGESQEVFDECKFSADATEDAELWSITNGHDICVYLGCLSRNGKVKLGENGMRNILIGMYRESDFKESRLYSDIFTYQDRYQLCYVN